MDWFTTDLHFGHKNILSFESETRPYASTDEMDKAIIDNINSVVGKRDKLFILGDIAFSSKHYMLDYLNVGNIVVILGNHDYPAKVPSILRSGVRVAGCMYYKKCILTHIPVHESQKCMFRANIHGHLHSACIEDPFYYNVSLERHNMMPVSWESLNASLA